MSLVLVDKLKPGNHVSSAWDNVDWSQAAHTIAIIYNLQCSVVSNTLQIQLKHVTLKW